MSGVSQSENATTLPPPHLVSLLLMIRDHPSDHKIGVSTYLKSHIMTPVGMQILNLIWFFIFSLLREWGGGRGWVGPCMKSSPLAEQGEKN